ncbi:hypothetical protein M0805_006381 [Coniferiporia weirii]|nr:hypothetical protein M0805_006381 [Coniferiporia weirii]
MSNLISNCSKQQQFSICPANGRQTVGDGASSADAVNPDVLAVCQVQGSDDIYYYSTTFSGGPTVRDWPASCSSLSSDSDSNSTSSSSAFTSARGSGQAHPNVVYPPTPPHSSLSLDADAFDGVYAPAPKNFTNIQYSAPRDIPISGHYQKNVNGEVANGLHNLVTPPHTPGASPVASQDIAHDTAAHDFLVQLFPGSARAALPYAKSVRIASSELAIETNESGPGFAFEGVVLDLSGRSRTLYIDGKGAENVKLRESIVALLDLADEHLECSALVLALERSGPALGSLLHSFMYVGATVVTCPPFPLDNAYVLVGIEI